MKKSLFLFFCILISVSSFSQRKLGIGAKGDKDDKEIAKQLGLTDSLSTRGVNVKLSGKTKYTDYKIISFKNDTTLVDTTLTLKKEYNFNFLRKDNFELLAFHNQGQTFNNLGYSFSNVTVLPQIGFRAKQFNIYKKEDIKYYQLPTPTTEILYRSGLQQGQVLDALFTLNFSKRLNVSLAYKGLRSLGHYRRSLASHGNFRATFHYTTPKKQYEIKGYTLIQDLTNQESGGLTENSLNAFITDDPNSSTDRERLDVNLDNAESLLDNKSYYLEHSFRIFSTEVSQENKNKKTTDSLAAKKIPALKDSINIAVKSNVKKDSIATKKDSVTTVKVDKKTPKRNFTNLKVGHTFLIDNNFYRFTQSTANSAVFGTNNATGGINNTVDYQLLRNEIFLDFNSKYVLGNFRVKAFHANFDYGYNMLINSSNPEVTNQNIGGSAIGFGANWNGRISNFKVNASATITPGSGRLAGNDFRGELLYEKDSVFSVKGRLLINSKSANYNTLFHQSNYDNYNWQNNFSNVNTRNVGGDFKSKWGNASLDITNINNYVFFDENGTPKQATEDVNYLKLKVNKEFKVGKFALDNTLMYQNVSSGSSVFRVPEFVTRNTFYYADNWFKGNPLFVNIGVTFKYFTKYKANAYNPLLAEFQLQNDTEIGFPTFDVFFNARVRRTRIYFKLENVTSRFTEKNYFSAPNYPYRDFSIRFGVVWNWFI